MKLFEVMNARLFESELTTPELYGRVTIEFIGTAAKRSEEKKYAEIRSLLNNFFSKEFSIHKSVVNSNCDSASVIFKITEAEVNSPNSLENYINTKIKKYSNTGIFDNCKINPGPLVIEGAMPDFPVYGEHIIFADSFKIKNLSKIDKVLKNAKKIKFNNFRGFKGGLLSLLNLSAVVTFDDIDPKLGNIIKKYLSSTSIDAILCCQEELITAGLKEYARL